MNNQELLVRQFLQQNLTSLQRYLEAAGKHLLQNQLPLDERTVQDATIIVEKLQKEIARLRYPDN